MSLWGDKMLFVVSSEEVTKELIGKGFIAPDMITYSKNSKESIKALQTVLNPEYYLHITEKEYIAFKIYDLLDAEIVWLAGTQLLNRLKDIPHKLIYVAPIDEGGAITEFSAYMYSIADFVVDDDNQAIDSIISYMK